MPDGRLVGTALSGNTPSSVVLERLDRRRVGRGAGQALQQQPVAHEPDDLGAHGVSQLIGEQPPPPLDVLGQLRRQPGVRADQPDGGQQARPQPALVRVRHGQRSHARAIDASRAACCSAASVSASARATRPSRSSVALPKWYSSPPLLTPAAAATFARLGLSPAATRSA